jgi:hypothetical protein
VYFSLPSCVIVVACLQDGRREHWQALYYNRVWEKLPTFACAKGLIIDTLSVISSVIAIYRLYSGQSVSISGLNSGLWSYPSLPGTTFGIWLWVASRMRMTGNQAILGGFLIVILITVSIALVVHLSLADHSFWIAPTVSSSFMALPVGFGIDVGVVGGSVSSLNAGWRSYAFSQYAYFPFCALKEASFGAPF